MYNSHNSVQSHSLEEKWKSKTKLSLFNSKSRELVWSSTWVGCCADLTQIDLYSP